MTWAAKQAVLDQLAQVRMQGSSRITAYNLMLVLEAKRDRPPQKGSSFLVALVQGL